MVDIACFSSILPADAILTDAADLVYYGQDSCKEFAAAPNCILLPRSHEQVEAIVRICNAHRIALVPSGGRTGYSGGATATNGEVVVSLTRMNKIIAVDRLAQTITCQAGVTTEALQQEAAKHELCYPVDFASKGSSQIGGNIATNAGGVRVIRYGSTRDWVLGLKVVTGTGTTLLLNHSTLFKDATGYDLRGLFIGSEGTLGIITEATLKLTIPSAPSMLALAALTDSGAAIGVLEQLRQAGLVVTLIEYFEHNALEKVCAHTGIRPPFGQDKHIAYLLLDVESSGRAEALLTKCYEQLLDAGIFANLVLAQSPSQRAELMSYRERISETLGKTATVHKNDISVPLSKIPDFIKRFKAEFAKKFPKLEVVVFGHIGDGNLHINSLKSHDLDQNAFPAVTREVDKLTFDLVQSMGGSISAEHGVGLLKRDYLALGRSNIEIDLMRRIKVIFDPANILNPGKLLR